MNPLDASFVDCFLAFLNDPSANARAAEKRFRAHPYITERLHLFKVSPDVKAYASLQKDFREKLSQLTKTAFLTNADLKELADALNRLQFDIRIQFPRKTKKRTPETIIKIGARVNYVIEKHRVIPQIHPTISGVEGACWYALMLIQVEPERVRICPLKNCGKFFDTRTTGQRRYCSKEHTMKADKTDAARRMHNHRHPDEIKKR